MVMVVGQKSEQTRCTYIYFLFFSFLLFFSLQIYHTLYCVPFFSLILSAIVQSVNGNNKEEEEEEEEIQREIERERKK